MIAVGIDPGRTGAIVALAITDDGIRCIFQKRTFDLMAGSEYLPDAMRAALIEVDAAARSHWASFGRSENGQIVAVLERCGAMPRQGLSSTFAFGRACGLWRGLLAGFGWAVLEPTPQRWQRAILADIPGEGKERSIARASQISGLQLIAPGCRKPSDGLADACGLALFGLRAAHRGTD